MLLQNKTALITGSNRGIGKAILTKFAEEGADIFAHARKESEEHISYCQKLAAQYNIKIVPVYFDAAHENEIKFCVKEIQKINRHIDILVNNLGVTSDQQLFQMTPINKIKAEFDINFFSQIYLTQFISRFMVQQKSGSIINITSCAGIDGNTGMLQYVSSKAAMIGATKRMAIELGQYNIRVNSIAPGLTDTQMGNLMENHLEQTTLSHQIFQRKANPEEIANAVLFFASDLSTFITGQTLRVDGGMLN